MISDKLDLQPMDNPFEYIKQMQAGFDSSKIQLTEDYEHSLLQEPRLPEWNVYFDGFCVQIPTENRIAFNMSSEIVLKSMVYVNITDLVKHQDR